MTIFTAKTFGNEGKNGERPTILGDIRVFDNHIPFKRKKELINKLFVQFPKLEFYTIREGVVETIKNPNK